MVLVINRRKQFVDSLRVYDILINEKRIDTIKRGGCKEIEVSKGDVLRFSIDSCSSRKVIIKDKSSFVVYNPISNIYVFISLFFIPVIFFVGLKFDNLSIMLSNILFLLYPMYKLVFDKNRYIKIS